MYTQCEHCKAIFRVNMREVTVAKGKLRCGECNEVFDASASLSTTIPPSFKELIESENTATQKTSSHTHNMEKRSIHAEPNKFTVKTSHEKKTIRRKKGDINWLLISVLLLTLLLIAQIAYNNKHILLGTPLHEPEKIQMLNHNVFAHPNESGVLLISALIENTGEKAQPYPILELRLENSQSKLVAFRRFLPNEYLSNYSKDVLLPSKTPVTLKLKIKDPGKNATRFQFDFL